VCLSLLRMKLLSRPQKQLPLTKPLTRRLLWKKRKPKRILLTRNPLLMITLYLKINKGIQLKNQFLKQPKLSKKVLLLLKDLYQCLL
jgi:hypothetical protein